VTRLPGHGDRVTDPDDAVVKDVGPQAAAMEVTPVTNRFSRG
jgi:hypothetical protein